MENKSIVLETELNLELYSMTKIESKKVNVACSIEDCYTFLTDLNNYELLLPKDKISSWESDEKKCSFKIQKTYKLTLVYKNGLPHNEIHLVSGENSPFSFSLNIVLSESGATCDAQLLCEADINPFLKMMVEKPLNNLFDYMADRLVKVKQGV
tara:strand:- start:336 stop:797 length:462 start_codon:yes stop_codon:yes gene_type:complete